MARVPRVAIHLVVPRESRAALPVGDLRTEALAERARFAPDGSKTTTAHEANSFSRAFPCKIRAVVARRKTVNSRLMRPRGAGPCPGLGQNARCPRSLRVAPVTFAAHLA